jgi:glycerol dehydrogenase-like iron-containing ADH family enzyme
MWDSRALRVAIVHDVAKESGHVLPHPSVIFPTYASANTPWVA